jgi:hypothetical protein
MISPKISSTKRAPPATSPPPIPFPPALVVFLNTQSNNRVLRREYDATHPLLESQLNSAALRPFLFPHVAYFLACLALNLGIDAVQAQASRLNGGVLSRNSKVRKQAFRYRQNGIQLSSMIFLTTAALC